MGRASQFLYLVKHAYSSPGISLTYSDPAMKRAACTASLLTRSVRKLLHMGILKYGKDIVTRQFLLRRISNLSMAGYGLLAALAHIDTARKAGEDVSARLDLLEYLTQEAREILRSRSYIAPDGLERAHSKVFAGITDAREADEASDLGGSKDE